jgi:hypothetical protein
MPNCVVMEHGSGRGLISPGMLLLRSPRRRLSNLLLPPGEFYNRAIQVTCQVGQWKNH